MTEPASPLDPDVPALGIRQPWVELILQGEKTLEVRSQSTRVRGEIYLYSAKQFSNHPSARAARSRLNVPASTYVRGMLLGRAWLVACRPAGPDDVAQAGVDFEWLSGQFVWEFERAERFDSPVPIRCLPYGVWFYPFRRKGDAGGMAHPAGDERSP
jgi:hypothetical protein